MRAYLWNSCSLIKKHWAFFVLFSLPSPYAYIKLYHSHGCLLFKHRCMIWNPVKKGQHEDTLERCRVSSRSSKWSVVLFFVYDVIKLKSLNLIRKCHGMTLSLTIYLTWRAQVGLYQTQINYLIRENQSFVSEGMRLNVSTKRDR